MSQKLKILFQVALLLTLMSACGVNSNILFKSPVGEYAQLDSLPLKAADVEAYKIGVEDKITFSLSTNNGAKLIENISQVGQQGGGGGAQAARSTPEFLVLKDSTVELPVLGYVKLAGLTIQEAEKKLEKMFSKTYQDPFIRLQVTNQRVIVFPGTGGLASVLYLTNSNTTLMEVIAQAGGIPDRGKANTVKLIRKVNDERLVYTIDLSTTKGLKYADVVVQANDFIYIEPKPQLARGFGQEIAPILALVSTTLVFISLITN